MKIIRTKKQLKQLSYNDEKIVEKFLWFPFKIKTYEYLDLHIKTTIEFKWLVKVKIKYVYTTNAPFSGDILPLKWIPRNFI